MAGNDFKRLYAKKFMMNSGNQDPKFVDFRIYGLHKKETVDSNGDYTLIEYYKDYDPATAAYSNLAVREQRTYTRDSQTGLLISRVTNIDWFDIDGDVQDSKLNVHKYYSTEKAFVANKRARGNLIDRASMYLFSALNLVDPLTAEANVEDFDAYTIVEQKQYVNSTTQPLLDKITNAADSGHADYRSYMTATIRDTLLVILNISYTS